MKIWRNWVKKFDILSDKLQSNLDLLDFQKIEDPNDSRLKNLNDDFENLSKISENPVFDKSLYQSRKDDINKFKKAFKKISFSDHPKKGEELNVPNLDLIKNKYKDIFETIIKISEEDKRFSFLDSKRTKLLLDEICERLRS